MAVHDVGMVWALGLSGLLLLVVACGVSRPPAPAVTTVAPTDTTPAYRDASRPVEERVEDLLKRMTIEEKITLIGGNEFSTRALPRLGIPEMKMTDGPHGARWGKACAFPSSVCMAATWDPDLIRRLGQALAQEVHGKGRHVILGPCVNIHRLPLGGRNWESFGEDPWLASRMAVAYVRGVQSESVVATIKHFACNSQEALRTEVDIVVDKRALNEIYFPAFKAAVQEGGAWAVMSAYNKLNGFWCSENPYLLTDVLKKNWGFTGIVMSDWGAVHSAAPTANAGLDLEMPKGDHLNQNLVAEIRAGKVKEALIDDKVRRLLRVMFTIGLFDAEVREESSLVNNAAHRQVARDVAAAGVVLLKNRDTVLPFDRSRIRSIAVIGPNAAAARVLGGGSGSMEPAGGVSPLDAIRRLVGDSVVVKYEEGCVFGHGITPIEGKYFKPPVGRGEKSGLLGEYFANGHLSGEPALTRVDPGINFRWGKEAPDVTLPKDNFSVRWTGRLVPPYSGSYRIGATSDDGIKVTLDGKVIIDNFRDHAEELRTADVQLQAGRSYAIEVEYFDHGADATALLGWRIGKVADDMRRQAVAAARSCDAAVVFAGLSAEIEGEGSDRPDLALPPGQDELIAAVAQANPRTVVVINNGGAILMGAWLDRVGALVEAWYPGQEGSDAIADILFGLVNPSGKLPVSLITGWDACWVGKNYGRDQREARYEEGIFVGYRWLDAKQVAPHFPFGHGLSYTTFAYSNLKIEPQGEQVNVTFDLENTGSRAGAEVAQVYVADDTASVPRPPRELKAFQKVFLQPGEKKTVTLTLDRRAFAFYDEGRDTWRVEPGAFHIQVGASSRDLRLDAVHELR